MGLSRSHFSWSRINFQSWSQHLNHGLSLIIISIIVIKVPTSDFKIHHLSLIVISTIMIKLSNSHFNLMVPILTFNIRFQQSDLNIKSLVLRAIFHDFPSTNSPRSVSGFGTTGTVGKSYSSHKGDKPPLIAILAILSWTGFPVCF